MRFICLFLILLISQLALSQPLRISELENKIIGHQHDTAYVNMLNQLAILYYSFDPGKTKAYGSLARRTADSLRYDRGLADAYFSESLISKLKGNYAEELSLHIKSIKIYQSLNDKDRIARTYDAMGAANTQQGDFKSAKEVHQMALALFKVTRNQQGLSETLRRLGNIELDTRNFRVALKYYNQALENERALNNEIGIANCLNNIGVTYYELKKFDSALQYHRESLAIMNKINFVSRLPAAYYNMARVYLEKGKLQEALDYADKGLPITIKIGSRPARRESYKIHAEIYQKMHDYANALTYFMRYSELDDSIINQQNTFQFANLHSVYRLEEKEREIELLKKDQELIQFTQTVTMVGFILFIAVGGLIIYYQWDHMKQKKKSYALVEQHSQFVLQVNEELKTNLEEIESKNKEITALAGHLEQVNTTKDKLFSIIGHDLLGPVHSLIGLLSLISNERISKEQFLEFSAKLKKDVEHFEFTLNNLLQWARGQLAGFQTNPKKIELRKLVERSFNFLMKNASDKNIELCNNINQEMRVTADQDQLDIAIRNLISNAIKFTPNGGKIVLDGTIANHSTTITITDTGIGMDQTTVEKLFKQNIHFTTRGTEGEHGSGLGLLLCKEMIERNNGKIGIESKPGAGTTFYIELPV